MITWGIISRQSQKVYPIDSHILYGYICTWIYDVGKRKEEKREKGPGRIVPDDFTAMINRHRLLIVLDLDGGTAGATGPCISDSTKGPRAFDSLGEGCSTYRL